MSGDFVCNVCGKQFGAKKILSQHNWAVHTESESNCTHCDKTFRSKKKLTYHMRSTHAENEAFHCDLKFGDIQCSYYSTSNSNLRVHVKRVHEKAGNKAANAPLLCGSCDYRTDLKTNLVRHKKTCTKSVEPNENLCNLCHKTFSTKKILHKHSKVHNKENTFAPTSAASCVVCEKTFAKKSNMERHKIKEHGLTERGNVVANSAGIAIFTTEALVKETVIGRTTTPTLCHQCDQCEFNSQKSGNLKRHVQIKHDGRTKPEMRGRKSKSGPVSDRTKRRRKADDDAHNLNRRDLSWLTKDVAISERGLRKFVNFTKEKYSASYSGNLRNALKGRKNRFKGHFKTELKEFRNKNGEVIERNLTCTKDLEAQIEKVIETRKVVDPLIIVGCDGGLGSFLVTLVVIDRTKNYKLEKHKPTGFPRLLIPAKVRDIPESTHNLRVIFDEIKINEVSRKYKMVGDLKVYNMLLGMQSSGSLHPCPYGLCFKVDQHGKKTNQKGPWTKGDDRTLEGNADEAKAFAETSQNRAFLQYFYNCEFQPVIFAQNSTKVLDFLTIPVLHTVLLGPFNSLWNTLKDHFPTEAEAYSVHFGMKGAGKGGDFNGNTVKDIIHDEMKLADLEGILPENAKIFVDCLKGIAQVHKLVTSPILDPDFESIISNFIIKWKVLEDLFGIGCTLKIHIIGTHLLDVLRETGQTLHDESDEPVEQAHFRVKAFENLHGYHTSDRKMTTQNAGRRQQRMMEHLNSHHLK